MRGRYSRRRRRQQHRTHPRGEQGKTDPMKSLDIASAGRKMFKARCFSRFSQDNATCCTRRCWVVVWEAGGGVSAWERNRIFFFPWRRRGTAEGRSASVCYLVWMYGGSGGCSQSRAEKISSPGASALRETSRWLLVVADVVTLHIHIHIHVHVLRTAQAPGSNWRLALSLSPSVSLPPSLYRPSTFCSNTFDRTESRGCFRPERARLVSLRSVADGVGSNAGASSYRSQSRVGNVPAAVPFDPWRPKPCRTKAVERQQRCSQRPPLSKHPDRPRCQKQRHSKRTT